MYLCLCLGFTICHPADWNVILYICHHWNASKHIVISMNIYKILTPL